MEQNQQNQATYPNQTQNSNITNSDTNTETKTKQTPGLFILFWLVIFAPIGLYLLWREKRLHRWFPNLLIFFGFLNILPVATMKLFVFPKLVKLYEEFGANFNKNNIYVFAIAILVISFVEVVIGIFLRKKLKEEGFLKNVYVFVCLGFFVFQYVPFGWLMQSFVLGFIMPIYNLTSQL